jgi:hypothetical protein
MFASGIPSTWSLVKSYFNALQTNMSNPIGYTVQAVEGTSSSIVGTGVTNCRFTDWYNLIFLSYINASIHSHFCFQSDGPRTHYRHCPVVRQV